jgi:hypothetical protein
MRKKPAWKEPRLEAEKIEELAFGLLNGQAFTSSQVPQHDAHLMGMIFTPIGLLSAEEADDFRHHPPALICGWTKDSVSCTVDGYPIFTKVQMIYLHDAQLVKAKFEKLKNAAERIWKP